MIPIWTDTIYGFGTVSGMGVSALTSDKGGKIWSVSYIPGQGTLTVKVITTALVL